MKTLFEAVVEDADLHASFKALRDAPQSAAARWMMDDVYQSFHDPDGTFLKQFQATGFDARTFELYLHAYFERCGFQVEREHERPDFVIRRGDVTVAVEATTVAPPTSGVMQALGRDSTTLTPPERVEYVRHELPIRFGSPLFSKLGKRYWELDHCRGHPLVLAVEAFFGQGALGFSDLALSSYAYGLDHDAEFQSDGELKIQFDRVFEHVVGPKTIPSNFFGQPDTEHISAILFTNAGTTAKFSRMGFQSGVGNDSLKIVRMGYALNPDKDARDATFFCYDLDNPPLVEPWGQGVVVIHNPNALHPVDLTLFPSAAQTTLADGRVKNFHTGWHPFNSATLLFDLGELKGRIRGVLGGLDTQVAIGAITKAQFREESGVLEPPHVKENGWYADEGGALLGTVTLDIADEDWGWVVLARDQFFQFRAIDFATSIPYREAACHALFGAMAGYLRRPQRIFPQSADEPA